MLFTRTNLSFIHFRNGLTGPQGDRGWPGTPGESGEGGYPGPEGTVGRFLVLSLLGTVMLTSEPRPRKTFLDLHKRT